MYQSNIYEYLEVPRSDQLLLCKDDNEAAQIRDVAVLLGYDTFVLPDLRVSVGEDLRAYGDDIKILLTQLFFYYQSTKKKVLVSPLRTVMLPFPKAACFSKKTVEFGDTLDLKALKDLLYHWGYHFVDIASQKGEVSFRGDIIDIYPIHAEQPYRISLFDEEVESIHIYDAVTQKRQGDELESMEIIAAFLALDETAYKALRGRCERSTYDTFVKDIDSLGFWHLEDLAESALSIFDTVN